jgi:hypothetical protein
VKLNGSNRLKKLRFKTAEIAEMISAIMVEDRQKLALLSDNHLRVVLHSFFVGGKKNPTLKIEIEAILSAAITGFKDISNLTMNDINQLIEAQKRELEQKLALITGNTLNVLMKEREAHEAKIAEIDAKLKSIGREIGLDFAEGDSTSSVKRQRIAAGTDISETILNELRKTSQGLSQVALSEATGLPYSAVINWVKQNPDKVRAEGERRGRKVYLI